MKTPPLSLEEAQARMLDLAEPLAAEQCEISAAHGRYLTSPLLAKRTNPSADLSAMDGYAVRPNDLTGPWRIVGESAAGHPLTAHFDMGQAVRISTGAVLPAQAAGIILQEDVTLNNGVITLTGELPNPIHKHIRRRGMDYGEGDTLLAKGTQLGAAQLALAISGGHTHVSVPRRPRLAIIDSGDELTLDASASAPHQVPASNGAMLAAMAASLTCTIERLGPVADNMGALAAALARAEHADLIVTSGGISVGDHDLIRPSLEAWGAQIDFWRVAIKPGKPLLVARKGKQIILGLPGNPVSSYVTALLFMMPLLRKMLGADKCLPKRMIGALAAPINPGGLRREFLRAYWDGQTMRAHDLQDSGALSALAHSNALIDRAANAPAAHAGELVSSILL